MSDEVKRNSEQNGWEAIRDAFDRIYADTLENTQQFGTLISWQLGGPDPLDSFRIYDGGTYWHIVGFGLSELFEKESNNPEVSGYGMEFTFKLLKAGCADVDREIKTVIGIFQDLARLTFEEGEAFWPYEYIYTGQQQGIDYEQKSRLTGFFTVPEPLLTQLDTPYGQVQFVELVGATDAELQAIMQGEMRVRELYEKLGSDITDLWRDSLV